jgi:hypothetical protein
LRKKGPTQILLTLRFESDGMKVNNSLFVIILLLSGVCCTDEPSENSLKGVIIETSSGEPIENVEIIGFDGGAYQGNAPMWYGAPISLGTSDNCGKFRIVLPENIKGVGAHGPVDNNYVMLRFIRPDVGVQHMVVDLKNSLVTIQMEYQPQLAAFFRNLFLIPSNDKQSVSISWNVHSLTSRYDCNAHYYLACQDNSNGLLYIGRSDSAFWRYEIPIEINNQQTIVDTRLPDGDFTYTITTGSYVSFFQVLLNKESSDTIFLVKPPSFPIFNHCN